MDTKLYDALIAAQTTIGNARKLFEVGETTAGNRILIEVETSLEHLTGLARSRLTPDP